MSYFSLDAVVVDPQPDCRMRLKNVIISVPEFRSVHIFDKLSTALEVLDGQEIGCDIIFLSERFGEEELAQFRKSAEETLQGACCAYVLLLEPQHQVATRLASSLQQGMDAVLFEPYSVDGVAEIVPVARQVQRERVKVQGKAAMLFLVRDCLYNINNIIECLKTDRNPVISLKRFQEVAAELKKLEGEALDNYFEVLMEECEKIPPPPRTTIPEYSGASTRVREKINRLASRIRKKEEEVSKTTPEEDELRRENISKSYYIVRKVH